MSFRIVFWQNCLSPHQLPYIVHLLDDERVDKVVIVAEEAVSESRKNMGWENVLFQGLDRCEVYLNPMPQMIDFLLSVNPKDSYHLFSGIRGFRLVFNAFKRSLKYNLKRGLITERPNTYAFGKAYGKPLWAHRLRFFCLDKKYTPFIHWVFAMGEDGVNYFRSVCKSWQVFPFAYCTDSAVLLDDKDGVVRQGGAMFVFVGSLSWRKAPLDLLKAKILMPSSCKITFVGDGPERSKLENCIERKRLRDISLLGTKKNSEISSIFSQHDILILPSIYDGWGAVVNEALQRGLYVICSDRCGAKDLLQDARCGCVFHSGNHKQLAAIMHHCCSHISAIRANRKFRQEWAERCISGKVIARYMVDCLLGEQVNVPWKY